MRTRILLPGVLVGLVLAVIVGEATFAQRQKDFPPDAVKSEFLGEDPLAAAEQFVEKTSKEVREAVDVLANEAESLRNRLQKIEAAHRRLQSVLRALDAQAEEHDRLIPMPGLSDTPGHAEERAAELK